MEEQRVTGSLKRDTEIMNSIFAEDKLFIVRPLSATGKSTPACTIFCLDGMVDSLLISQAVIKPICIALRQNEKLTADDANAVISGIQTSKESSFIKIAKAVNSGNCALFFEGSSEAIIVDVKRFEMRAVTEPESEKVLRGPREGFVESAKVNLSMLRRRLNSNAFKTEEMCIGAYTGTKVHICYLSDRVNKDVLAELKKRLGAIRMDGVLDSNYLLEQICDAPLSPFNTIGHTERPDVVAAKMLEGRVAIIADGSPIALTVPHLLIEVFQSNNDYYTDYIFGTISRVLRIIGFLLATSVPAIYIAIVSYQHEVIPRALLLSLAASRQGVPFTAALEAAILLLVFDILRQASLSMPGNIGQTLSIVGALILGEAAVQAKLVSAPLVIVVALSGTTSLLLPKAANPIMISRTVFFLLATVFGIHGFMLGLIILVVHVCSLRSFGISYVSPQSWRNMFSGDILTRTRWGKLKYRRLFKRLDSKISKEE